MSSAIPALYAVVRGLIYVGLLLLVGSQVAVTLLRRQIRLGDAGLGALLRARLARVVGPLLLALVALILVRGALQLESFVDPGDQVTADLARSVLVGGPWAHAWLLQLGAAVVLLAAWRARRRMLGAPDAVLAILIVLVIWGQAGMGHAAGDHWPWRLGRLLDTLHVFGAGIWLGTLGILMLVALPVMHADEQLPALATAIRAFSVYARVGAALVVVSGVTAALVYSGASIPALVGSTWGRLLLGKLAGLVGVAAVGWYNWRIVTPALDGLHVAAPVRLRTAIRVELLLGLVMLALTAVLVASPLPGES